jgi:integrase
LAAIDAAKTPFIESMADVMRIYQALRVKSPTVGTAYAVGALAGLRTSEVRALDWSHVDLERGAIHVQVQVGRRKGRDPKTWSPDGTQVLKDGESRVVPIQPSLAALLASWREVDGGKGLVFKPLRQGSRRFLDDHTMSAYLRDVLVDLKLARDGLGWYESTGAHDGVAMGVGYWFAGDAPAHPGAFHRPGDRALQPPPPGSLQRRRPEPPGGGLRGRFGTIC